nr:hypothetical protein [uncultured Eisenbergiella sp.]
MNDTVWRKQISGNYDVVNSTGLIEHFQDTDIQKVIDAYFELIQKNGLIVLTFPTPTLLYRIVRKVMELIGMWQFWDESPLRWEQVNNFFEAKGYVLDHYINRALPLT